jgi:hypothetical protein
MLRYTYIASLMPPFKHSSLSAFYCILTHPTRQSHNCLREFQILYSEHTISMLQSMADEWQPYSQLSAKHITCAKSKQRFASSIKVDNYIFWGGGMFTLYPKIWTLRAYDHKKVCKYFDSPEMWSSMLNSYSLLYAWTTPPYFLWSSYTMYMKAASVN